MPAPEVALLILFVFGILFLLPAVYDMGKRSFLLKGWKYGFLPELGGSPILVANGPHDVQSDTPSVYVWREEDAKWVLVGTSTMTIDPNIPVRWKRIE